MDKLIEALRETLAKLGLDEGAVDAALEEAMAKASEPVEEQPAEEGNPTEIPNEEELPPLPPESVVAEETPSEEPSSELPVEETPAPEGEPLPPQEEVAPVEPTPAPAMPPFDPTELLSRIDTLQGQLDEQLKANDGLKARIDSLEEALKSAGVIDGSNPISQVGDPLPSAAPQNPTDDVFASVLDEMNGHKRF